jgi:pyruvate/2-oxoglutarate/acetoin dehydrogenase E1 component
MANYEVTYEYIVPGIAVVMAETPEDAETQVKNIVESKNPEALDFETFSIRVVDGN